MLKYFLRRLLAMIPKLIVITIVIFIGLEFVPGDPLTYKIPMDTLGEMSEEAIEALRESYGLNDPPYIRYFKWVGSLLQGDLGISLSSGVPIGQVLLARMPATLEITVAGLLISTIFGLLFGFFSALKKNTPLDYTLTAAGMVGVSIPEFFFGLCAIQIFALTLKWLPPGGRTTLGKVMLIDRLDHLVMPVLCVGIAFTAVLMRYTRGAMLDVMNKDYIKASRSKGISETRVNVMHTFRNAMIPIMIIIVNRIPILISGTVVIESVFNYPGMGSLLLDSISSNDMPVVMIATLFIAIAVLLASFLIDIFSALLDPRIRFGEG